MSERQQALLALHDCRIIRATANNPVFADLWNRGLAMRDHVPGKLHMRDYRLSTKGRAYVKAALL